LEKISEQGMQPGTGQAFSKKQKMQAKDLFFFNCGGDNPFQGQ
jgi:hypothetical protein